MSIEASASFNLSVKKVEFFPYEWSQNLLAVCLSNEVRIYSFNLQSESLEDSTNLQSIMTIPFQNRIDHFSWSPKTNVSTLKPVIQFSVCDNNGNLIFCTAELGRDSMRSSDSDLSSFVKTTETKINADIIYDICYDHQNGELLAYTADNDCYVWDCDEQKYRTQFVLQSPGIGIRWHRDEKNKLMIAERSGLIRIYNTDTLKPMYTLLATDLANESASMSLLTFDWCQTNPEVVIATTRSEIIFWNSSISCLPANVLENNLENLKICKIAKFKEDIIGYLAGTDTCSKITIHNYRLNQIVYQGKNMKLLSSFSFNSILPVVAIANEQKLTVINLINHS